eukprot:EG_transcript_308
MGAAAGRVKASTKDDVVDLLRNLSQAYRDDQRMALLRDIYQQCATDPHQLELFRQVSVREGNSVNVFEQIFRVAYGTYDVAMKTMIVDLTLLAATAEGVQHGDLDAIVAAGVSQLTLDVFAFAKAYKAASALIENATALVDVFIRFEGFTDQFVKSGGSKILFGQLVAKHPTDVPRKKAMRALEQLAQRPAYLKGMSESGGISALVESLCNLDSKEFLWNALKILVVLSGTNSKLLAEIMEVPDHLRNILVLLDMDDETIISNSMCILASFMNGEKNVQVMKQLNGFPRILAVFRSQYIVTNRRLLLHTVVTIAGLLMDAKHCVLFHEQGGLAQLAALLSQIRLVKGWPTEAIELARQMDKKKLTKAMRKMLGFPGTEREGKGEAEPHPLQLDKDAERPLQNEIIRASLTLLDRLIDGVGQREVIASTFAFDFYVPLVESCAPQELGIVQHSESFRVNPVHQADQTALAVLFQTPPPNAPQVFDIVQSSLQLLAKLCTDSPTNAKALAATVFPDEDSLMLEQLLPVLDSRSLRITLACVKLVDQMVPDVWADGKWSSSFRLKADAANPDRRFAKEPLLEVLPVTAGVVQTIITSLFDVLEVVDLVNRKGINLSFQLALLNASVKLLVKLARYRDTIPLFAERMHLEPLRRLRYGGPFVDQIRKANATNRYTYLQNYINQLLLLLSAADEELAAQLADLGLKSNNLLPTPDGRRFSSRHGSAAPLSIPAEWEGDGLDSPGGSPAGSPMARRTADSEDGERSAGNSSRQTHSAKRRRRQRARVVSSDVCFSMQLYRAKENDTLRSIAKAELGTADRWGDIRSPDGRKIYFEPDEALPEGLVLSVPSRAEEWLSPRAISGIRRRPSLPLFRDADGDIKPDFVQRYNSATQLQPTRMWLNFLTPEEQAVLEEERKAREAAEAARLAKERQRLEKRHRAEQTRMGKAFLADYQVMAGEEEVERVELMRAFAGGVEHIRRSQKQRNRVVLDAMEERECSEAEEASARRAIEVGFVVEEELVDRTARRTEEDFQAACLVAQMALHKTCLEERAAEADQEEQSRVRLARQMQVGVEVLTTQAKERQDFADAEEAARTKLYLQRDAWDIKAAARRGMLDLEHEEAECRYPLVVDRWEDLTDLFETYQLAVLGALGREEAAGRAAVQAEEGGGERWLQLETQMLQLQVQEVALRKKGHSFMVKSRKVEFEDFFEYNFELLVAEEQQARTVQEVRRDRFATDNIWRFAALGLQHSEEYPRRRRELDFRTALAKLHQQCSAGALAVLQLNEEQWRAKKQAKWQRTIQDWRDQKQRLRLIGIERQDRATLAKGALQELKALVAQGRLGRALIGMIDLQAREVVAREAQARAQRIQYYALLQTELFRRQAVARAVMEKAEHRGFERIGRGLENYLHMCGLDKASMLFDMWRPNDVLLVPFVVPPIKGPTRAHRVAEVARLRTAARLDQHLHDSVPRSIQTSSTPLRPSTRWTAADNPREQHGPVSTSSPSPLHPPSSALPSPAHPKRSSTRLLDVQASDRVGSPSAIARPMTYAPSPTRCPSPGSLPAAALERTFLGLAEVEAGVRGTLQLPPSRPA